MRRRVLALLLCCALIAGGVTASAAGSADDPLVSKSLADSWAIQLAEEGAKTVDAAVSGLQAGAIRVPLSAGSGIKLRSGSSAVLLSGSASAKIGSGALLNATRGSEAGAGSIAKNELYICCEASSVTLTASAASTLLVWGDYTGVQAQSFNFTDVAADSWFREYVYTAVELGLVDGVSETSYAPDMSFTVAQAIKIAACMHQLYYEGEVTLENGDPWYASYVSYAVNNGIAPESYGSLTNAQYDSPISRRDYVRLFYRALPASEYAEINSVADNAIPDVAVGSLGSAEIYAFYRAGILEGTGADGSFLPESSIKRSEVAAIIVRMFDTSERKSLTLG